MIVKKRTDIEYLSDHFADYGIKLIYDPANRKGADNVMGIFFEEQPLMWELFRDEIKKTTRFSQGVIDFLDVGTGSGFWAIVVAKNIGGIVHALDISKRAILTAKKNAKINDVTINFKNEAYSYSSASPESVKAIYLNPPYHIYPLEIEGFIPLHARGGPLGFEELTNQLRISNKLLSKDGKIFFHHMCLGKDEPEFVRLIQEVIEEGPEIQYVNIFPPMSTRDFLEEVYEGKFKNFIHATSHKYPRIFFCDGVITKGGSKVISSKLLDRRLVKGKTWSDRILLHKFILTLYLNGR